MVLYWVVCRLKLHKKQEKFVPVIMMKGPTFSENIPSTGSRKEILVLGASRRRLGSPSSKQWRDNHLTNVQTFTGPRSVKRPSSFLCGPRTLRNYLQKCECLISTVESNESLGRHVSIIAHLISLH